MSFEWDAAIPIHARFLGYSCPSSASDFGSTVLSSHSRLGRLGRPPHTHVVDVSLSPSTRKAQVTSYRPVRRRSSAHSAGRREIEWSIASEGVVARHFAGVGPTGAYPISAPPGGDSRPISTFIHV